MGDQDIGSQQGQEGMIEDHLSLEDLLLATLDAGALLTKAKGRLQHGSGETGCTAWAWHRARRPRG